MENVLLLLATFVLKNPFPLTLVGGSPIPAAVGAEDLPKHADVLPPTGARPKHLPSATPFAANKKLPFDIGTWGTDAIPIGPLDPEHPQRISDCTIDKVIRRMSKGGRSFVADTKYDGERLICIKKGKGQHKFFSRNMLVVPERKLDGVREAIDKAFGVETGVAFDAEILSKCTFGSMNKVKKWELNEDHPIRIYIFDVMWINGHNCLHLSLDQRRNIQYSALKTVPNLIENGESRRIDISTSAAGSDHLAGKQLQAVFDTVMADKLEGIVVKPCDSPYSLGGTHWVKLKKNYIPVSAGVVASDGPDAAAPARTAFVVKGVGKDELSKTGAVPSSDGGKEEALRHNLKLADTVDALVVAKIEHEHRYLIALRELKTNAFQLVGFVHDPSKLVITSEDGLSELPQLPLSGKIAAGAAAYLYNSLRKASLGITAFPVVEVAASRLVELVVAKEHGTLLTATNAALVAFSGKELAGDVEEDDTVPDAVKATLLRLDPWTISLDATVVRLRDDKSMKHVTPIDALKGLLSEATLKLRLSFPVLCEFASENSVDVDFAGAEEDEDDGDVENKLCSTSPYYDIHTGALFGMKGKGRVIGRTGGVAGSSDICTYLTSVMTSKTPPTGTVMFLLLPLLRERAWQDRGLMGEITKSFGPAPKNLVDSTVARKNSAGSKAGGIVIKEVTCSDFAPVHVAVLAMGCLELSPGATRPTFDPLATRTALRRVRNLCLMLSRNSKTNGVKAIELHTVEADVAGKTAGRMSPPPPGAAAATFKNLSNAVKVFCLGPLIREEKENQGDDGSGGIPVSLHIHAS